MSYTPKHDISKVKPFKVNKKLHTNLEQFSGLVENGQLNEIAYWFVNKENNNPDFKYSYDGGDLFEYKMKDFLSNALEVAIYYKQKDVVEFLLFDPLVKDKNLFVGKNIIKLNGDFSYSNCIHNSKEQKEVVMLCLKNGVYGYPFEVAFPVAWVDECLGLIFQDPSFESNIKQMERCLLGHYDGTKEESLKNLALPDPFQDGG